MIAGILGLISLAFSLLYLIVLIWALIGILTSSKSAGEKILWVLVVFLFPIIGLIIYIIIGRK